MVEGNTQLETKSQTGAEIETHRLMLQERGEIGAYHQKFKDHDHLMTGNTLVEGRMIEGMTHMIGQAMIDPTIVEEEGEAIGLMIDPIAQEDTIEEAEEGTFHAAIEEAMIEGEVDMIEGILEDMTEEEEVAMIEGVGDMIEDIQEGVIEAIPGDTLHEETEVTQGDTTGDIAEEAMSQEAVDTEAEEGMMEAPETILLQEAVAIIDQGNIQVQVAT